MSQLTDQITAYPASALATAIEHDPALRIFNLLWNTPEQLAPAVAAMGLNTIEDLLAWVSRVNTAIGNTEAFEKLIDPPVTVDYASLPKIEWAKIHEAFFAQTKLADDLLIHNSDAQYALPTKAQWGQIAATCPVKTRKHSNSDVFDCDDFVRFFLGWLAGKGLGNCAAGLVATRHYVGEQLTGGHALVGVMDATQTVWFIEPQDGKLYTPAQAVKLGGNFFANSMSVARVIF